MHETPKTKGEMAIERIMGELDPQSERYRVLATARQFKSSWVELGEKLLEVQQKGLFRHWGYDSFEDYCAREVRIKQPTAQKLTLAYRFLEKEEPELLARRTELKPLPDYRSVDLLRQAREELDLPAEDYAGLRRAVVEEERSHPTVQKRFRQAAGTPEAADPALTLRHALAAAGRLQAALQPLPALPAEFIDAVSRLCTWLGGGRGKFPGKNKAGGGLPGEAPRSRARESAGLLLGQGNRRMPGGQYRRVPRG